MRQYVVFEVLICLASGMMGGGHNTGLTSLLITAHGDNVQRRPRVGQGKLERQTHDGWSVCSLTLSCL